MRIQSAGMSRSIWHFCAPARVVFGSSAVHELGPLACRMGISRPLVVTDEHLVRAGIVERVLESLRSAGIEAVVFQGGRPEPSYACAQRAIQAAIDARPDAVIGLGGGSNLDLAKITASAV